MQSSLERAGAWTEEEIQLSCVVKHFFKLAHSNLPETNLFISRTLLYPNS